MTMKGNFSVEPTFREVKTIVKKYTDEEKQEFANEAADINERIKIVAEEKKKAMDDFNAKLKEMKSSRDSLTSRRLRGFEEERVECAGELEEHNGKYFVVFYDDLGEEVERRAATPAERQSTLFTHSHAVNE